MNAKSSIAKSLSAAADLRVLLEVIARSPIRSLPAVRPQAVFADWSRVRHSAEVDELILAWIASHVQAGVPRSRLH